jgi:hypothetical protein
LTFSWRANEKKLKSEISLFLQFWQPPIVFKIERFSLFCLANFDKILLLQSLRLNLDKEAHKIEKFNRFFLVYHVLPKMNGNKE